MLLTRLKFQLNIILLVAGVTTFPAELTPAEKRKCKLVRVYFAVARPTQAQNLEVIHQIVLETNAPPHYKGGFVTMPDGTVYKYPVTPYKIWMEVAHLPEREFNNLGLGEPELSVMKDYRDQFHLTDKQMLIRVFEETGAPPKRIGKMSGPIRYPKETFEYWLKVKDMTDEQLAEEEKFTQKEIKLVRKALQEVQKQREDDLKVYGAKLRQDNIDLVNEIVRESGELPLALGGEVGGEPYTTGAYQFVSRYKNLAAKDLRTMGFSEGVIQKLIDRRK